jgi:ABC-type transporter MlaC component
MKARFSAGRLAVVLPVAAALLAAAAGRAADPDPAAAARASTAALFERLAAIAGDDAVSADRKRALLEHELEEHLDLHALSGTAVGPLADRFTPEQLVEFSKEYERYLLGFLLVRIANTDPRPLEITDARHDPKTGVVALHALGNPRHAVMPGSLSGTREAPQRVTWDLELRQRGDRWLIRSMRINGVDVSDNFRAQLESVLRRSDPAEVIADLRARNDRAAATNPFE